MTALSLRDRRYLDQHAAHYDPELDDMDSLSGAWRAYIDERNGKVTHRSRGRLKSTLYDWQRIDAWMTAHRMSNSNLAFMLGCSSGTIANIRSGHYQGAPTIKMVENLITKTRGE